MNADADLHVRVQARELPPAPVFVADPPASRLRAVPLLVTSIALVLAGVGVWAMWQAYMAAPWTRDGTVRAYVVTMAPEVAGRIVGLPVADNQLVQKGDPLMVVDPTNYAIAVRQSEAAVEQAKAVTQSARAEAERRCKLTNLSVSDEEKEIYASRAMSADAAYQQAVANLDQARVNLERTRIVSPVTGYVTNLQVQLGDFVNVGQRSISVIDAASYWVDAYFEETSLRRIHDGDLATVKLMGGGETLAAHVESVARGINVPNAQSDSLGLASVNPIFTWVRLAQRVPVRIRIDKMSAGTRLVQGVTATVEVHDRVQPPNENGRAPVAERARVD